MIKKFVPCNGTHGDFFMSEFCYTCSKWSISSDAKTQCDIWIRTQLFDVEEKEYPLQWRYIDDIPVCTAYKNRDKHNEERRNKIRPKSIKKRCSLTMDLF